MKRLIMGTVMVGAVLGLAACGAVADKPLTDASASAKTGRQCFSARGVRGYTPIDDRTLLVDSGPNEVFSLTMFGGCFGLQDAMRIGLRARGGLDQICGPMDLEVLFADQASGRVQRCSITEVKRLTPEEITALDPPRQSKKKPDPKLIDEAAKDAAPKP